MIARQQGRGLADLAAEAGAELVGGSSLKAALDLDWDEPTAREQALRLVLGTLDAVERWLATAPIGHDDAQVADGVAAAQEVRAQDVMTTTAGAPALRQGVASDRRISIEDAEMRHGRKSRSQLVNGYKRHVLRDLDSGLVPAVGLTPANAPEASLTDAIVADLAAQQLTLRALAIDRAYLSSALVRERPADLAVSCKAWPVRTGPHFPKTAIHSRLGPGHYPLPPWGVPAVHARRGRAFPGGALRRLPVADALYRQYARAHREHPSR